MILTVIHYIGMPLMITNGTVKKGLSMTICKDCGRDFNPKGFANKAGYINQCGKCAKDVEKYVGRMGGSKSNNEIVIFRKNIKNIQTILNKESSAGMSPNLIMNSPTSHYVNDKEDREELSEANEKKVEPNKSLDIKGT